MNPTVHQVGAAGAYSAAVMTLANHVLNHFHITLSADDWAAIFVLATPLVHWALGRFTKAA